MNINNIEDFLQWLTSSKDIAAGEVSSFLNGKSEEDINSLVNEYKSISSFKLGGKINSAAEMFKCGGKAKKKKVKKCEYGASMPRKVIHHDYGKDELYVDEKKDSMAFIKPNPNIGGEYSIKKDAKTGNYSGFYDNIFGDYRKLSPEEAKNLFRDFIKRLGDVKTQQDGGELLSRKDLKNAAKENYGYNGQQFRDAYRNSIAAYQSKGYKRSKAKEFAQEILTRTKEAPVSVPVIRDLGSSINTTLSVPTDINMPVNKFSTIVAGNFSNTSDYDSMSFNDAFGSARKAGDKTFLWRGKEYGTQLRNNTSSHNVNTIPDKKMIIPNIDYAEVDPMVFDVTPVNIGSATSGVMPIPALGNYGHMIEEVSVTSPSRSSKSNTKVSIPVISGIPGRFGLYRGLKKGGKLK